MHDSFNTLVSAAQSVYPVGMIQIEHILVATALEESGGVDEKNLLAVPKHFTSLHYQNAGGEAGAIEVIGNETDHRFEHFAFPRVHIRRFDYVTLPNEEAHHAFMQLWREVKLMEPPATIELATKH